MMRKSIFSILPLLVLLAACNSKSANKKSADDERIYPAVKVAEKDTLLNVPYVADIQAQKNVELRSRTEGVLEKIFIKEGQYVSEGQLLFKISDSDLQIEKSRAEAAYNSALADAKVAEVEVDRVQILVEKKVITQTELELAKAKHKALLAKADIASAEKNAIERKISYTRVLAPFTGVVDRIPLKEGSLLPPGSLLTTLSDVRNVYAYFNISENEYFQIVQNGSDSPENKAIRLVLPDGSVYPYTGILAAAESEIDGNTGNIAFKAIFTNPQHVLRHGASGKILIERAVPRAILVPQKAVFEIQDKNYVFMLDGDNVAKMKSIGVNQRIADYYIVNDGLNSGDKVIVEGIQSIRDGQKVQIKML